MPIRRNNSLGFFKKLHGGQTWTVTLLKRGPDQLQGQVASHLLFNCLQNAISKQGQTLQGDMDSDQRTVWWIPRQELMRVGVLWISPLDRIVDTNSYVGGERYWQPESDTLINVMLFENIIQVACKSVNPPDVSLQTAGLASGTLR